MPNGRFLVLDDDPDIGRLMCRIAQSTQVEARHVAIATDFFQVVQEWQPTHIAIDLIMPDLDGIEVMRQLAALSCGACIIITSGVGTRILEAAQRSAREHKLNVIGMLPKPFQAAMLRGLLNENPPPATTAPKAPAPAPAPAHQADMPLAGLIQALDEKRFKLFFQPKIDCRTGKLAGFEALARGFTEDGTLIMPDRFIPLAEKNGLMGRMTDLVLELALAWLARTSAHEDWVLSVNLSAQNLTDIHLADRIAAQCQNLSIAPERMIFEVTESSAMRDPSTALDLLTRLRIKGFLLSIDDFGTGFSSMVQLVRLPFSEMKIDRSFVLSAARSQESRTIIKSIISLGHSLGINVTAEGIEDQETLDFLRQCGCNLAQGYFIGRPMEGDAIAAWMAQWESRTAILH